MSLSNISIRMGRLSRLLHPSAWRFLTLVATDPSLDKLYDLLRSERLPKLLDEPYPRFSLAAVDFIDRHVHRQARVLEWGSGSSTLWFAARGCSILSVEHDPAWHKLVSERLVSPSLVLCRDLGAGYFRPTESIGEFDLITIDGRQRCECARLVLDAVESGSCKPGLILVFDDTERPRYRECLDLLARAASWHWTYGGTSGVVLGKTTSVFRF